MEFDTQRAIKPWLQPGEMILWDGRQVGGLFSTVDLFFVPFSLLWAGFAVFWFLSALRATLFMALFGIPLLFAGAYFLIGRFIVKWWARKHTVYVITNMRVLVMKMRRGGTAKLASSAWTKGIVNESLRHGGKGRGTIVFGHQSAYALSMMNSGMDLFAGRRLENVLAFFNIDDCERVFQIYYRTKMGG